MALFSNDDEKFDALASQIKRAMCHNEYFQSRIDELLLSCSEKESIISEKDSIIKDLKNENKALIKRVHTKHSETQRLHARCERLKKKIENLKFYHPAY